MLLKLTDKQWARVRGNFPEENLPPKRRGRPPVPAREVLDAALWILATGAQRRMLPQGCPNCKTVHRRFQQWCRSEVLRDVLADLANGLREEGRIDEREGFIDGTFVLAKGGGEEVGWGKRGKGMKIMGVVDRRGLPLAVSAHAANHHEVKLVQLCFDFCVIEAAKPENLIGDRACDSDELDGELRDEGVEMIAPHRRNRRKMRAQDGRRLRRCERRWLVERFFGWLQWSRRLIVRWECYAANFIGFLHLGCIGILLKQF